MDVLKLAFTAFWIWKKIGRILFHVFSFFMPSFYKIDPRVINIIDQNKGKMSHQPGTQDEVITVSLLDGFRCIHVKVKPFPSVRPSVRPHSAKSAKNKGNLIKYGSILVVNIKCTLYGGFVSPFFCLSVCQLVGPSIGSFIGPSTGWMHRCLPVRLVIEIMTYDLTSLYRLTLYVSKFPLWCDIALEPARAPG